MPGNDTSLPSVRTFGTPIMKGLYLLALGASLLMGLTGTAVAQTSADAAASTRIQEKFRRMELLNLTLPVLMTQKQINGMLPLIEKSRKADQDLKAKEAALLKTLEADCDNAIKNGTTKRMVVPSAVMQKLQLNLQGMAMARQVMVSEHLGAMTAYVKANLDASQQKVCSGLISASWINRMEPEKVTDEQKLSFWIANVILDPLCYSLLVEMAKVAPGDPAAGSGE